MLEKENQNRVITVPNILSALRILLIPVFLWLYCVEKSHVEAGIVIAAAGASDIADGVIARRFLQQSNLGRVLDPAADKLTQAAMCFAMVYRYPFMVWLLVFFGVKELAIAFLGWVYMKKTGVVNDSRWYGKASSIVQYAVMLALILNPDISNYSAYVLISLCMGTHVLSLLLYIIFYIRSLRNPSRERGVAMRPIDWQIMVMYLLLMLSVFMLLFTSGDSYLHDVLPEPLYHFLRFASIVGTLGVPSFFIGEKLPREWFDAERFPFSSFAWEKDGKVYEKIGVRKWKKITPDMSKYIRRAFPKQGSMMRDAAFLRRLLAETCSAEIVHWGLILFCPVFPILMEKYGYLSMLLFNIGNLLPIIIQRYNRPRVLQIVQRIERRK